MNIKLEMDSGVVILRLHGSLVASTVEELRVQTSKLIEKRYKFILLDLSKVDFMDSCGLGACMGIKRDLAAHEGFLACTGLNEYVGKLFQMTRADQKIMIFTTYQSGVNALLERLAESRR